MEISRDSKINNPSVEQNGALKQNYNYSTFHRDFYFGVYLMLPLILLCNEDGVGVELKVVFA